MQQLHHEFDLADATGSQLDVLGQVAPLHLGGDQCLHLAKSLEGRVVEVAAIDEGSQRVEKILAGSDVACDRPRLDPGVALPVTAFALEVLFHGAEAQRQSSGLAERAQAHVDAEGETLRGDVAKQLDQALSETQEPGFGVEWSRAVAAAGRFTGVAEHEVDVGAEVEFGAAELAQSEHRQAAGFAILITQPAVALGDGLLGRCQGELDAALGLSGARGQRVFQRGATDLPPEDVEAQRMAIAAQGVHAVSRQQRFDFGRDRCFTQRSDGGRVAT